MTIPSTPPNPSIDAEIRPATLNFMDASVKHSLYRNGEVLTQRNPEGNDFGGYQGVTIDKQQVEILNGRRSNEAGERCTLAANGFELLAWPHNSSNLDFFDHQQVATKYYAQCVALIEDATDAHAFAFDHNVRSASGKENKQMIRGGQQVQGPAHIVHGDYTLASAPQRLRELAKVPSGNDTLRSVLEAGESLVEPERVTKILAEGGRYAIINVWRNIASEPVATRPLALCDAQTVAPEDLVVFEIHYQDRVGENYFSKHSRNHRWYCYPEMTGDEALLIKQWDSAGNLAQSNGAAGDGSDEAGDTEAPCTFSFHTAFRDPTTPPDAPDRLSIEVRCIVFYD
jgi:hypothetical protein